jgi:hypothetical protein
MDNSIDFEKVFADFIDRHKYDKAQNALFDMVRISFTTGWKAAGGNTLPPQPIIELLPRKPEK